MKTESSFWGNVSGMGCEFGEVNMSSVFYKVLRLMPDGLLISSTILSDRAVVYKPHEWARAKRSCGPLCVFDNMVDARLFAYPPLMIWPCEIQPASVAYVWAERMYSPGFVTCPVDQLPDGTVLAWAVKLLDQDRLPYVRLPYAGYVKATPKEAAHVL